MRENRALDFTSEMEIYMKVIGITGGVGAGKSLILDYLKRNYIAKILIADDISKNLCISGERCFEPLIKLLGKEVLGPDGEIDRSRMASMIFENDSLREKVNDIIHPKVKEYIMEQIAECSQTGYYDFLFIEAALLIEAGYGNVVDEMWYIYTEASVRRSRLKASRGYSDAKIDSIMASQLTEAQFCKATQFTIDNSKDREFTYQQIRERMNLYYG